MIYNAPGIYVKEVPSGARPIQAVGTSTAAFVGVAPDPKAPRDRAIPINNWTEFVRTFAGNDNPDSTHLSQAVYGFFLNGGRAAMSSPWRRTSRLWARPKNGRDSICWRRSMRWPLWPPLAIRMPIPMTRCSRIAKR